MKKIVSSSSTTPSASTARTNNSFSRPNRSGSASSSPTPQRFPEKIPATPPNPPQPTTTTKVPKLGTTSKLSSAEATSISSGSARSSSVTSLRSESEVSPSSPTSVSVRSSTSRIFTPRPKAPPTEITEALILEAAQEDDLSRVYELFLPNRNIERINEVITKCVHLKAIDLSYNIVKKIENVSALKELKEIKLCRNKLKYISGLEENPDLQNLILRDNQIAQINGTQRLTKLKVLNLEKNCITKIENLLHNDQLTFLDLSMNQIEKLENLSALKKLEDLYLSHNKIKSCFGLERLSKLTELQLDHNNLTSGKWFKSNSLRVLRLDYNSIKSLDSFPKIPTLTELYIAHNELESVEGISELFPELDILDISDNKLKSLSNLAPLSQLPELMVLKIKGNPLCSQEDYFEKAHEMLPQLSRLDDTEFPRFHSNDDINNNNALQQLDEAALEATMANLLAADLDGINPQSLFDNIDFAVEGLNLNKIKADVDKTRKYIEVASTIGTTTQSVAQQRPATRVGSASPRPGSSLARPGSSSGLRRPGSSSGRPGSASTTASGKPLMRPMSAASLRLSQITGSVVPKKLMTEEEASSIMEDFRTQMEKAKSKCDSLLLNLRSSMANFTKGLDPELLESSTPATPSGKSVADASTTADETIDLDEYRLDSGRAKTILPDQIRDEFRTRDAFYAASSRPSSARSHRTDVAIGSTSSSSEVTTGDDSTTSRPSSARSRIAKAQEFSKAYDNGLELSAVALAQHSSSLAKGSAYDKDNDNDNDSNSTNHSHFDDDDILSTTTVSSYHEYIQVQTEALEAIKKTKLPTASARGPISKEDKVGYRQFKTPSSGHQKANGLLKKKNGDLAAATATTTTSSSSSSEAT